VVGYAVRGGSPVEIEVISDVVCPWCYVGKRRLEQAVATAGVPFVIRWRPYQLDPTIPPEGKPRRAYMEQKFGSVERIRQIHERIEAVGAAEGIPFAFDRIEVSPNTLDAHRLLRWAGDADAQEIVVEALFRAYFVEGRDIGDRDVLAEIAATAGLDGQAISGRLASEEDREAVGGEVERARIIGVTGVPTFILAGRYGLVGAQPAEEIAQALREVAARQPEAVPI
jgi:predicted DsbA family dithiol-disulfide isomerase